MSHCILTVSDNMDFNLTKTFIEFFPSPKPWSVRHLRNLKILHTISYRFNGICLVIISIPTTLMSTSPESFFIPLTINFDLLPLDSNTTPSFELP